MTDGVAPPSTAAEERVAFAVLAEQVLAVRETLHHAGTVEMLWRASDALQRAAGPLPADDAAELGRLVEEHAFQHAQALDRLSQMAEGVATALRRASAADRSSGGRLTLDELSLLYVSEEQRRVHEAAARRFLAAEGSVS